MKTIKSCLVLPVFILFSFALSSCAIHSYPPPANSHTQYASGNYESRLPSRLSTGERTVLVDPNVHAWGAYNSDGSLVRAGLATAGSNWCPDLGRPCHTHAGSFRVQSLGSPSCKSTIFPVGRGGAPMPYCMYFNGGQALHGTGENELAEANLSHGCVRMHVADAEWLRYNFVNVGTKVVVQSY